MEDRKMYDTDVTLWSPSGRLYQVEYAMEAVKLGSLAIGVRSDTRIVLASFNKAASKLLLHQKKIFRIDDHIGVAISGLAGDGRLLLRYLRDECVNYRFESDSTLPVSRLVVRLADKAQFRTQRSWKRPYGVGLLLAGLDAAGPHLYYSCPSGNYSEYVAFAIGSRATSAKTYLERTCEEDDRGFSGKNIIKVALSAMKEALRGEELTSSICTVAVLGVDEPFHIVDENTIQELIVSLKIEEEAIKAEALQLKEEVGTNEVPFNIVEEGASNDLAHSHS